VEAIRTKFISGIDSIGVAPASNDGPSRSVITATTGTTINAIAQIVKTVYLIIFVIRLFPYGFMLII